MATFYCPIELVGQAHLAPTERFFFVEVEAPSAAVASQLAREEVAGWLRHPFARWWPERECPSFEEMAALRRSLDLIGKRRAPRAAVAA